MEFGTLKFRVSHLRASQCGSDELMKETSQGEHPNEGWRSDVQESEFLHLGVLGDGVQNSRVWEFPILQSCITVHMKGMSQGKHTNEVWSSEV